MTYTVLQYTAVAHCAHQARTITLYHVCNAHCSFWPLVYNDDKNYCAAICLSIIILYIYIYFEREYRTICAAVGTTAGAP